MNILDINFNSLKTKEKITYLDELLIDLKDMIRGEFFNLPPSCFPYDPELDIISKENGLPKMYVDGTFIRIKGLWGKNMANIQTCFTDYFCILYTNKDHGKDQETVEKCIDSVFSFMKNKMEKPEIRLDYVFKKYDVLVSKILLK